MFLFIVTGIEYQPYKGDLAKSSPFCLKQQRVQSRFSKGRFMDSTTKELIDIFARTQDPQEMEVLFQEIFTPSEIGTLTLRWQLLKDLYEGKTQRKIAAEHKISLCKITRGSKILKAQGSYLKKVLDGTYGEKKKS
jgi:TrpR family trp operon transcriptional repressor